MNFLLRTEDLSLSLSIRVFESDIQYSTNTIMDVEVESNGFTAKTSMDIDIKEFAKFASDLYDIYISLNGEAKIIEPYGEHMYITFRGDTRGHIQVNGFLCNRGNVLKFENIFDQTYLLEFCHELKKAYKKYLI